MKRTYILLLIAVSSLAIISCTKNSAEKQKTVAERIQGKWMVDNVIINTHSGVEDHRLTIPGDVDDYVDFKPNGVVANIVFKTRDVLGKTYIISDDATIIIDGKDPFTIQNLTDHTLTLYGKAITSDTEYRELTINLKK
jgi:hypothetical protein